MGEWEIHSHRARARIPAPPRRISTQLARSITCRGRHFKTQVMILRFGLRDLPCQYMAMSPPFPHSLIPPLSHCGIIGIMATGRDLSVDTLLKRVDQFFMGESPIHKTVQTLARRLPDKGIDYAIVGAMALFLHGYRRETVDVDLLMTQEGLERFREQLVGLGYLPAFPGAKRHFLDTETGIRIDILMTGEYPGDGKPKPVVFPDPSSVSQSKAGIQIIRLDALVELKLASGISAQARLKDLADVQEAIKELRLPRTLGEALNPYVREKYFSLWDAVESDRLNQSRPDYDNEPDLGGPE